MDKATARRLLLKQLAKYRSWPYAAFAAKIDETRENHECLESFECHTADSEEYYIEINVFWDDKERGDVRVIGNLSSGSVRGCLFGWFPVLTPDVSESFIMAPDGTFVGE